MSTPNPITQLTEQAIQNLSFDKDFNVFAFEMLGYYPGGNSLVRIQVDANGKLAVSVGGFTAGSVIFAASDGTLTQDNANLFFDDTNNRLGIGTASPWSTSRMTVVDPSTNSQGIAFSLNALPTTPHAFVGATNQSENIWITAGAENTSAVALSDGFTARNNDAGGAGKAAGIRVGAGSGVIDFWTATGLTNASTFTWVGSGGVTGLAVRIASDGKVGLATVTPRAQLSSISKNGYHISSTDVDSGGYIDTGGASALYLTGGAQYSTAATTFTAKTTSASTIELESGTIRFYTDSGLVAGNTYTASERARITNAGLFGIGLTPTALLHMAAGTTAASTAPMKFTTGSLMTTAEIGAVEYNGNHYRTTAGIVRYSLGGTIFDHYTDGASTHTDGTFDDLYTDTTIANTFKVDGDKVMAEYSGIFVAHATATRNVKVLFAGSTIFDSGALATTTAESWQARVTLIRVSSTSVRCVVSFAASTSAGANAFSDITYTLLTSLTLSGTNILKVTGAAAGVGAASSDIVAKIGTVRFYGAV